ncbi:hypothetical protein CI109_100637 [Kwoniella shandongensis]|uniref:Mitochondrial escape protein 2 n=1 Tax=Kwoniella shandongensis TaxID=1734106 RepID=A0A5M6BZI7_9TREE|nr:uncharacterized protein CI109_003441 [Kwoniella shandongensis]KAA5528153.1 hypothetical protein CI109_003441 [Kwoniella shandongensis]
MMRPRLLPLKHPLRSPLRALRPPAARASLLRISPTITSIPVRHNSTTLSSSTPALPASSSIPDDAVPAPDPPRVTASFYISNVLPIKLAYWDFRPSWGQLREESLLETLHDIAQEVTAYGFRVESWEVSRKDGGVFMHFSYIPPKEKEKEKQKDDSGSSLTTSASTAGGTHDEGKEKAEEHEHEEAEVEKETAELAGINVIPDLANVKPNSPGRLFIPKLEKAAQKHGGWPNWLGQWATRVNSSNIGRSIPGHAIYSAEPPATMTAGSSNGKSAVTTERIGGDLRKGSEGGVKGLQAIAGAGRVWVVKGKQWTEDLNRYPSGRLRVEFDGPDVSQEMLYTLFRPYGRLSDIQPPTPVPAGSLRYATVAFSRLSSSAIAINCLHGYSTPTNTADFTLRTSGGPSPTPIPLSRLRLYYERPLKAHAIRDWISGHPRIALPVIAFLIGTLSYTFFDPIRAFFVRAKVEGVWDLEKYSLIQSLRKRFVLPTSLGFLHGSGSSSEESEAAIGKDAWKDRVVAEKDVEHLLSEYPGSFITITGPPGSGKVSLVTRVLKQQDKPALVIDCAEIAKAKNDAGLVSALADETGYYPVFSFMSSLSGLIDLAAVGLIGQKAGFSTPLDQQLRQMLEIVGGALKDVSVHAQQHHKEKIQGEKNKVEMDAERERRRQLIARGGWHDGRLDCVAGIGPMSELGLGDEPFLENDLDQAIVPLMDDNAPIHGEAVPPTAVSLQAIGNAQLEEAAAAKAAKAAATADLDAESELIKSLPIVVLKNFAQKTAKGDLWNVLAEWGASLVENRVAHVIVITEGATATKALTKALPSKPLNSVGLADADEVNALNYVREKLRSISPDVSTQDPTANVASTATTPAGSGLSTDDSQQIAKLGGRMVDLETLVYKVRTGSKIKDAVDDIILRNVVELRKLAFGDDSEDAKSLQWTRAQAWKVVSDLAKKGELSYAQLLQDFPFKGAEQSLKALEEHELVSVTYIDGRASKVKPGKPVFRYAFEALVNDPVFKASCQIEYNTALINKAEADIKTYENELTTLKGITTEGGSEALGVSGGWLGFGAHSAIRDRAKWLLDKMGKGVEKLGRLEKENEEMGKLLASGRG